MHTDESRKSISSVLNEMGFLQYPVIIRNTLIILNEYAYILTFIVVLRFILLLYVGQTWLFISQYTRL